MLCSPALARNESIFMKWSTKIGELMKVEFTKSELVYLLVVVSKEQAVGDPGSDWTEYFAQFFAKRYG